MKVDIFTLCDGVQCYENKLVVVGAYDTLFIQNFVASPVSLNMAARIIFDESECGDNTISVEATELATGLKVLDIRNSVKIIKRDVIDSGLLNVALNGVLVMLPRAGKYSFKITVEGRAKISADLTLTVIKAE